MTTCPTLPRARHCAGILRFFLSGRYYDLIVYTGGGGGAKAQKCQVRPPHRVLSVRNGGFTRSPNTALPTALTAQPPVWGVARPSCGPPLLVHHLVHSQDPITHEYPKKFSEMGKFIPPGDSSPPFHCETKTLIINKNTKIPSILSATTFFLVFSFTRPQ